MDRNSKLAWFSSLLTAGVFLIMMLTWIDVLLDVLDGSRWFADEFVLGFACSVSFVSLLATHDPLANAAAESGNQ